MKYTMVVDAAQYNGDLVLGTQRGFYCNHCKRASLLCETDHCSCNTEPVQTCAVIVKPHGYSSRVLIPVFDSDWVVVDLLGRTEVVGDKTFHDIFQEAAQ